MPTAYAAGLGQLEVDDVARRNASGTWIRMPAPSPESGSAPDGAAVVEVAQGGQALGDDLVAGRRRSGSRRRRRRRRRARPRRVVQALSWRNPAHAGLLPSSSLWRCGRWARTKGSSRCRSVSGERPTEGTTLALTWPAQDTRLLPAPNRPVRQRPGRGQVPVGSDPHTADQGADPVGQPRRQRRRAAAGAGRRTTTAAP